MDLLFFETEDKGDSAGGLDSDSSCSSPAPPSQRTGTSIALSGTHYQTPAGLLKGTLLRRNEKKYVTT